MRIEMFGGLRVSQGEVSLRLRSRQAETLLAMLALSPGRNFARDALAARLWPDTPLEISRRRFNQELSVLRRSLAPLTDAASELLLATPEGIRLDPTLFTTDVFDFDTSLSLDTDSASAEKRIQLLEQAVLLVRGPLLPGNYDPSLLQERERLAQACGEAFHLLARLYAVEGEMIQAVQAARSAVRSDPFQEERRATLILLSLRSGPPAEAQAEIDAFAELLMQEFGEPPSTRLLALAQLAQRFASPHLSPASRLSRLSPALHRLLNTLVAVTEASTQGAAIDVADLSLLENLAQLEEQGLVRSEASEDVMTYHLLPELKELFQIPL